MVPLGRTDMSEFQEIIRYQLFTLSGTPVSVATLAVSVLIVISAFVLARIAEKAAIRFLRSRGVKDDGSAGATGRLLYYSILSIGIAVAIHAFGINLTAFFAAGAFLAIAIGFAMQNITQNFVSGLILLVERTIKPGDIIEVEDRVVKVTKLGMRATVVRTWDSEDFIIPNSILVSNTVKNFTLRDRLYRIRALVGVTYDSDMKKVRQVLEDVTRSLEWRDRSIDPVILMKQFGSSSVDFDVSVWVNDPFARAIGLSNLNSAVWFALKNAGITIAFPQLDVHLDQRALEAIRRTDQSE
jgi:small-conductance mechanosensitive channel